MTTGPEECGLEVGLGIDDDPVQLSRKLAAFPGLVGDVERDRVDVRQADLLCLRR